MVWSSTRLSSDRISTSRWYFFSQLGESGKDNDGGSFALVVSASSTCWASVGSG